MTVYGNYDVIAFRSCIQIFTVWHRLFKCSGQNFFHIFVIVLHLKCKKNLPTAFGLALFYFSGNIFFDNFEIRNTSFSRNVPYFCQLPA